MPLMDSNSIRLYYECHGTGPALLFISGLGGGTWSWYGQVPFFEKDYRTIVFDNRGAGRSSMPPGPYRMDDLARDAAGLLDSLGVRSFFLVGLSMGGMIAQQLALSRPHRVKAMVLGCTHCGGSLKVPPPEEVLSVFINNEGLTFQQILDKNLPFFFSDACLVQRPELVRRYRDVQLQAGPQPQPAFEAQLAAIQTFDVSKDLPSLSVPTLVVTGTEDRLVPPRNAEILAKLLPEAELVKLQGAGHALHAERPGELNRLIHSFFEKWRKDK